VWGAADLPDGWVPAQCTGWPAGPVGAVVGLAGRFANPGGERALLDRLGAVSAFATIRYWSVTRQRWRALLLESYALQGPNPLARRGDFSPEELLAGERYYLWQSENGPAGAMLYEGRVLRPGPGRLRLDVQNALPVRRLGITLIEAGAHRLRLELDHERGDEWRYYHLQRTRSELSLGAPAPRASLVNRAVALFRHLAGLPTDTEPPAAPGE
jgi:hypothetical protein